MVVVLCVAGCSRDGSSGTPVCPNCGDIGGASCENSEDCPIGETCVDGTCQVMEGCDDNDDCAGDRVCRQGSCYAQATDGGYFDTDDDQEDAVDTVDAADTGGDIRDGQDYGDVQNCRGCIASTDTGVRRCVAGTKKGACGSGGEACKICDDDQLCEEGECVEKPCTRANCAGCCRDGNCVSGDSAQACGSGGEQCDVCSGAAKCVDGACEIVCGPDSCAGCCSSSGKCLGGDSDESCGSDGSACTSCASDEKCANGECVLESCSSRCSEGCCAYGTCKDGTTDQACGDNGDSCQTCDAGHECEFQECDLVSNSRWDVIAVSAEVPETDENGVFWDSRYNKPDVFMEVRNKGYTETKKGKTSVDDGDLTPFWYETTVSDARAIDLKRANKTYLRLVDKDPWYDPSGNDEIAECSVDLEDRHFDGQSYTFVCDDGVTTEMTIKLRHHP